MQKIITPHSRPPDAFEKLCEHVRNRDNISRTAAMEKARKENPVAFLHSQAEGATVDHYLAKRTSSRVPSQAWRDSDRRVREIASEQKVSRTDAMTMARKELTTEQWHALQAID